MIAIPQDIRDIRGPVMVPAGHPWWLYVAIGSAVILLLALTWRVVKRRRPPLSPEARALQTLEAIRPLLSTEDSLEFSARISDTVRTYVEEAFSVRAPRRTTEELLTSLMGSTSPVANHREALGSFLSSCDLAKYARFSLSGEQKAGMLQRAETFVRATAESRPEDVR